MLSQRQWQASPGRPSEAAKGNGAPESLKARGEKLKVGYKITDSLISND